MSAFSSPFTTHRFEIELTELNQPVYLLPFGDIHRFADNCAEDQWLEYLDWAKTKERAYFLGMGDYDDLASNSERAGLLAAKLHDSTKRSLDDYALERTNKFIEEISFMKGRLIGMIEGNHHYLFASGITSTQKMCEALGTQYLGISSFIRLVFKRPGHSTGRACLDIFAHHGKGGGTFGSSMNSVEKMDRVAEADIYLMGDDHKKWTVLKTRMKLKDGNGHLRLHHRKILLARTGSFQLGYVPGQANFVSSFNLSPTDLGVVKIELTPRRDKRMNGDSFYIDIHASI